MIFRPFYDYDHGCAAYVFGCGTVGLGAVVDPRLDHVDEYADFAAEKGLRISHVLDTHIHADHPSGGPALAAKVGAAYCLHESAQVALPFQPLHDGEEIVFGNTRIHVLHTPGHTPESCCYLVTDLRRGPAPWFVLTGDTLFSGAVGRPDLPGDAEDNARRLYDSLHAKLLRLPDELEVFPAHFLGSSCGVGMSGKPMSTLGFERNWNHLLAASRPDFIAKVQEVPDKPADMHRILRINRGLERLDGDAA